MKTILLFFLPVVMLLSTGCDKDKEGSLTLHFQAEADNIPVEMFDTYNIVAEGPLQFTHLSMLVSDLQLLSSSGNHYLRDVALVDMSFDDPTSAAEGFTLRIDGIPAETYDGISFSIGVPPDLNNKVPADFPSSSPLSKTGYYWQAWDSYIFMKVEGRIDTAEPGDFETSFTYHTGSNDLLRTFSAGFPLEIESDKDLDIHVLFEYSTILDGVNIPDNPQNHNPEDSIHIAKIVNNLQNAIFLHL